MLVYTIFISVFAVAMQRRRLKSGEIAANTAGLPKKRRRIHSNIQSSTSDTEHALSLPSVLEFSCDQHVQGQSDDELLSTSEVELNFFYEPNSPDKDDMVMNAKERHPLGWFATLPTEIIHLILASLENSDLAALASVSAEMCVAVCGYVYTRTGLNNILPKYLEGEFADPMEFANLGV